MSHEQRLGEEAFKPLSAAAAQRIAFFARHYRDAVWRSSRGGGSEGETTAALDRLFREIDQTRAAG